MATKVSPRDEFLSDILITASEGGINYWARLARRVWANNDRDVLLFIELYDVDERTGRPVGNVLKVGYPELEQAIALVVDPDSSFEVRDDIREMILVGNALNDAGEIDADAADVIIQAACFQEIVYS